MGIIGIMKSIWMNVSKVWWPCEMQYPNICTELGWHTDIPFFRSKFRAICFDITISKNPSWKIKTANNIHWYIPGQFVSKTKKKRKFWNVARVSTDNPMNVRTDAWHGMSRQVVCKRHGKWEPTAPFESIKWHYFISFRMTDDDVIGG